MNAVNNYEVLRTRCSLYGLGPVQICPLLFLLTHTFHGYEHFVLNWRRSRMFVPLHQPYRRVEIGMGSRPHVDVFLLLYRVGVGPTRTGLSNREREPRPFLQAHHPLDPCQTVDVVKSRLSASQGRVAVPASPDS